MESGDQERILPRANSIRNRLRGAGITGASSETVSVRKSGRNQAARNQEAETNLTTSLRSDQAGQVSRPEQNASVKAPALSFIVPAAASSASSETSKVRISSSL